MTRVEFGATAPIPTAMPRVSSIGFRTINAAKKTRNILVLLLGKQFNFKNLLEKSQGHMGVHGSHLVNPCFYCYYNLCL